MPNRCTFWYIFPLICLLSGFPYDKKLAFIFQTPQGLRPRGVIILQKQGIYICTQFLLYLGNKIFQNHFVNGYNIKYLQLLCDNLHVEQRSVVGDVLEVLGIEPPPGLSVTHPESCRIYPLGAGIKVIRNFHPFICFLN